MGLIIFFRGLYNSKFVRFNKLSPTLTSLFCHFPLNPHLWHIGRQKLIIRHVCCCCCCCSLSLISCYVLSQINPPWKKILWWDTSSFENGNGVEKLLFWRVVSNDKEIKERGRERKVERVNGGSLPGTGEEKVVVAGGRCDRSEGGEAWRNEEKGWIEKWREEKKVIKCRQMEWRECSRGLLLDVTKKWNRCEGE